MALSVGEKRAKIEALVFLEANGELPPEFEPVLSELREKGIAPPKAVAEKPGLGESLLVGIGRGAQNTVDGIEQAWLRLTGSDEDVLAHQREVDAERREFVGTPVGGSTSGVVGEVLGETLSVSVPVRGPASIRGASAVSRIGKEMLRQGAINAGLESGIGYTREGDSRLDNTLLAGGLGAGAGAVLQGVGDAVGKVRRHLDPDAPIADPDAAKLFADAEAQGIPLYPTDVSGGGVSNALENVQQALDVAPLVGKQSRRGQQLDAVQDAAEGLQGRVDAEMSGTAFAREAERAAAAATRTKRSAKAKDIEEAINATDPGDWQAQVALSSRVSLLNSQMKFDAEYERLAQAARGVTTNPTNTIDSLGRSIDDAHEAIIGDPGLRSQLENIYLQLDRPLGYTELHRLRSDLGDLVSDFYSGKNAALGRKGVAYLQQAAKAVDQDMEVLARTVGGKFLDDFQAVQRAYRQEVVPFRTNTLLRNLESSEYLDQFANLFVNKRGSNQAALRQTFQRLEPRGQAALRAGAVASAIDYATSASGQFSPAKFAGFFDQRGGMTSVVFEGAQVRSQLDGLRNVMAHLQNARLEGVNTPTGARLMGPGIAGLSFLSGGAGGLAASMGAGLALRKMFQTPATARILVQMSEEVPGSFEMGALAQALARAVGHFANQQDDRQEAQGASLGGVVGQAQTNAGLAPPSFLSESHDPGAMAALMAPPAPAAAPMPGPQGPNPWAGFQPAPGGLAAELFA